jgi:hypothetical protein
METKVSKMIEQGYKDVVLFNTLAGNLTGVTDESVDAQISFIFSELEETITGFEEGNRVEVLDGACDLFVTVAGLMQKLEAQGYDVATALDRVNANNLTKFPKDVSPEDGRQYTASFNAQYSRYVLKDSTGKVRKPSNFVSVYLGDLLPVRFRDAAAAQQGGA